MVTLSPVNFSYGKFIASKLFQTKFTTLSLLLRISYKKRIERVRETRYYKENLSMMNFLAIDFPFKEFIVD